MEVTCKILKNQQRVKIQIPHEAKVEGLIQKLKVEFGSENEYRLICLGKIMHESEFVSNYQCSEMLPFIVMIISEQELLLHQQDIREVEDYLCNMNSFKRRRIGTESEFRSGWNEMQFQLGFAAICDSHFSNCDKRSWSEMEKPEIVMSEIFVKWLFRGWKCHPSIDFYLAWNEVPLNMHFIKIPYYLLSISEKTSLERVLHFSSILIILELCDIWKIHVPYFTILHYI